MGNLLTIIDLARLSGCPLHTVRYAILRHAIKADGRIGTADVFLAHRESELVSLIRQTRRVPKRELAAAGV